MEDREAWHAAVHQVVNSWTQVTEQQVKESLQLDGSRLEDRFYLTCSVHQKSDKFSNTEVK